MQPELQATLPYFRDLREAGVAIADEPSSKRLLAVIGIPVPDGRVVRTAEEAARAALELATPVAAKLVAHDLPHKSEVGGVRGPLSGGSQVEAAAQVLLADPRSSGRVLVEAWQDAGVACFAGLSLHGRFGPLLSFGLGGLWVEVLRDVRHRLAPVSVAEAAAMVDGLRGAPVLHGARGRSGVDVDSLLDTLVRLSQLASDPAARDLFELIEINPLQARPCTPPIALDCTIHLRPAPQPPPR